MTSLVKSSFRLNLTILRLLGLYPRKKHSKFYLLYGYVLLFCSLLPDPIFGTIYYLRDEDLTLLDAGLNLFMMVVMLGLVPKVFFFLISNEKIRDCIFYLELFNGVFDGRQKEIFDDSVWVCQRNSKFFFFFTIFNNIMWCSRPLFSPQEQRKFLMDVWLPFDPTKNDVVYYFVYVVVAMGVTYMVLTCAAIDPLVSGLAYHAAGQVKMLKDKLEFLVDYAEAKIPRECGGGEATKSRVIYGEIRECVQHHHRIICFVEKIESSFSWVVFSQFCGSTFIICVCCFQLSLVKPESGNFLLLLVYLSAALIQMYFYCFYGSTLYEESNTLATAAYLGRWYEYDLKSHRTLLLFMERAKIPMTVTAGKLLDVSLRTFTEVLKKSYSLLAVLKNY